MALGDSGVGVCAVGPTAASCASVLLPAGEGGCWGGFGCGVCIEWSTGYGACCCCGICICIEWSTGCGVCCSGVRVGWSRGCGVGCGVCIE